MLPVIRLCPPHPPRAWRHINRNRNEEALAAQRFEVDRRKIQLEEPIKQLGEFKVPVRLHKDVAVEITVNVVKEAE